ncbi:MAG: hypothetical protein JXA21_19495 [Anaerolineae bacterium]|nr:hypothetical protein [Anaerolineae bacterium]
MYTNRFKIVVWRLLVLLLLILTMACSALGDSHTPPADTDRGSGRTPVSRDADGSGASEPDAAPKTVAADAGEPAGQPDGAGVDNSKLLPITPGAARVENGFLIIPGMVENRTGAWINFVKVSIRLFDKDGKEITTTSTLGETTQRAYTSNRIVPPGEIGYFDYIRDLTHIEGTYDHYELTVQAYETDLRTVPDVLDLVVENMPDNTIAISGKLSNSGSETCEEPVAVIVASTGDGLVYSIDDDYPDDDAVRSLAPGESAAFSRVLNNFDAKIANVKVVSTCSNY